MPRLTEAHIGLGSNLEPRREYMVQAACAIAHHAGPILHASPLYESEPWGFQASTPFLNQILCIRTPLPPLALLYILMTIESNLGRTRHATGYASRSIDLDILLYGPHIVHLPSLIIPHPRIPRRRFVLLPLAEMMPHALHPTLGLTWRELLDGCTDTCWVRRLA